MLTWFEIKIRVLIPKSQERSRAIKVYRRFFCARSWVFSGAFLFGGVAPASGLRAATLAYDITGLVTADDNLFRVSREAKQALPYHGHDSMRTVGVAASASESIGNLNLSADAALEKNWFAHNKDLGNLAYAVHTNDKFSTSHLSVEFDGDAIQRLSDFADIRASERNIQRLEHVSATITQEVHGYFRAVLGSLFSKSTNSSPLLGPYNYSRYGFNFGIGFYSPAGNHIALLGQVDRSSPINRQLPQPAMQAFTYRPEYTEKSMRFQVHWEPSVVWLLDGQIGYARHVDQSGFGYSFGGPIGDAALTWSPLDAVKLKTSASRKFETSSEIFSNGVKETAVSELVTAAITPTVATMLEAGRQWRNYRYDAQATEALALRNETLSYIGAGLNLQMADNARISVDFRHEKRSSSVEVYNYKDNVVRASVRIGRSSI